MIIGLKPCDSETLAFYRARVAEYMEIADALGVPAFSKTLRADLQRILKDVEAVRMVEALTRIGQFGDAERYRSLNANVKVMLNRKGIRFPKGRRPAHPGLEPMVTRLAPVLMALGVRHSAGNYSQLPTALTAIADEIGVSGDMRGLLKNSMQRDRKLGAKTYADFLEAFARGIAPDPE